MTVCIGEVAGEEEIVPWGHSVGETHEKAGVEEENAGHVPRDLFGRLVRIEDAREDEAPVGRGAPEVDSLRSDWRVQEGCKSVHVLNIIIVKLL